MSVRNVMMELLAEFGNDIVRDAVVSLVEEQGIFGDVCRSLYNYTVETEKNGFAFKATDDSRGGWCIKLTIKQLENGAKIVFLVGESDIWIRIKGWGDCPVGELKVNYEDFCAGKIYKRDIKTQHNFIDTLELLDYFDAE